MTSAYVSPPGRVRTPAGRAGAPARGERGSSSAELLGTARETPELLITDPPKEIRTFRIASVAGVGAKRGRGRGSFIDSVLGASDDFYADILQNLKSWSATPPKLRSAAPLATEGEPTRPASLASTDYSSQDGPDESSNDGTGGQAENE